MKKILYTTKLVALAMAVVFTTAFTNDATAKTLSDNPLEPLSLSFNYVGTMSRSPVFKLSAFNPNEDEFLVEVYDQDGVMLYTETVEGTNVSKKFLLNKYDLKDAVLTFKVTGNKTGEYSMYQIDCNTLSNKNWTAKKVH